MANEWRCALCSAWDKGGIPRGKQDRTICAWCEDDLARRGYRRCRKCGPQPVGEFTKAHPWQCKSCRRAYRKQHYQENKAAALAYQRDYWTAHHAERLAYHRARRESNRALMRARQQAYYAANRERENERKREDYQKNRDARIAYAARYRASLPATDRSAYWKLRNARRKLAILRGER